MGLTNGNASATDDFKVLAIDDPLFKKLHDDDLRPMAAQDGKAAEDEHSSSSSTNDTTSTSSSSPFVDDEVTEPVPSPVGIVSFVAILYSYVSWAQKLLKIRQWFRASLDAL